MVCVDVCDVGERQGPSNQEAESHQLSETETNRVSERKRDRERERDRERHRERERGEKEKEMRERVAWRQTEKEKIPAIRRPCRFKSRRKPRGYAHRQTYMYKINGIRFPNLRP